MNQMNSVIGMKVINFILHFLGKLWTGNKKNGIRKSKKIRYYKVYRRKIKLRNLKH